MERILPPRQARHPLYRAAASRAVEAAALANVRPDLGETRLMVRAGAAVARLATAVAPFAERFWVAAGPGNNGGDGIEAAGRLHAAGRRVSVTLAGDAARLPADAVASLRAAQAGGVLIELAGATPPTLAPHDLAIDALLGLGSRSAPAGALGDLVNVLNAQTCNVLAVDLPTGLDGDTGQPFGKAVVRAQHTLTLLTLKPGLFTAAGRDHAGTVWLDDLGCGHPAPVPDAWLGGPAVGNRARLHAAHKGSFGDVIVVGGAAGMSGAALLCARAAHAAGAGRVWVVPLDPAASLLDPQRPELMWRRDLDRFDDEALGAATVVCGCGGGDAVQDVLARVITCAGQLVLDADALNAIAAEPAWGQALTARRGPSILTPHPLEAARLLDSTTAAVQADRLAAARALADRFASVVVLKGSGSVIAAPGTPPLINASGNAALATAGSGDVLAGWLAGEWVATAAEAPGDRHATLARAADAAARAVWWHGAAAEASGLTVIRAGDLIDAMAAR